MNRFGDLRPLQRRPESGDTGRHFVIIPLNLSLDPLPVSPFFPGVQVSQRSLVVEALVPPGLGSERTTGNRLFLKPCFGFIVGFFLSGHSFPEMVVSGHKPAFKRAVDFLGV